MKNKSFPVPPAPALARGRLRLAALVILSLSMLAAAGSMLFLSPVEAAPAGQLSKQQKRQQATRRRAAVAERARKGAAAARGARAAKKPAPPLRDDISEPTIGEEGEGEGKRELADARQRWFMMRRSYPFDAPPAEARLKAFLSRPKDAMGRGKYGSAASAAVPTWRSIGPAPTTPAFPDNWGMTSGRINTIAIHPQNPQIILIGAATGGIWRSTDGGTKFVPVSDSQVDLAVGSIAFAKSNPSIVYAGMGDLDNGYFGTGVLKSTDAGATWARVSNNSLPPLGTSAEIEVDPTNPNRVYVLQATRTSATSYNDLNPDGTLYRSGFYLSTDGGVNWQRTLRGRPRDIAIHPTNPQILYLGMTLVDVTEGSTSPGGLYKSLDGGATWSPAPIFNATVTPTLSDVRVAVTPAAPDNVYVISGSRTSIRVDISNNGGLTWTIKNMSGVDPGQFGYNSYIYVSPTNPNAIYIGTRDVYRSGDGGNTWGNITRNFVYTPINTGSLFPYNPFAARSHPDQHTFAFHPQNPNIIYIGNDGGISVSSDGGESFQSLNSSLTLTQFVGLSMHPTDAAISYGGTQDNGTQRRVGGTSQWKEFSAGDGGRSVVNTANPSIIFTTYIYGSVRRYINNGLNFGLEIGTDATFGETASSRRIAFYPPLVGNGVDGTIYFGTYRLFTCTNCAATPNWTAPGGTKDLTKQEGLDCNMGVLHAGCGDVLSAIGVQRAALSPSQVIYTGSAFGRVMMSPNGGATWSDVTGTLPNRFVESITVHPTNPAVAYVTFSGFGTGHVFRTVNFGASWTNIGGTPGQPNAIPNVPVNAFLIDPLTPTTLYAGSDIGVFRSTDDGATWATFNNGMLPVVVTGLAANASGAIQLSTYGRGMYELTNPAPPCSYAVTPGASGQSFPASGGAGSFNMITGAGCEWRITSLAPWITITSGASGSGNGTINFSVAPNSGNERTGQILHTDDSFYNIVQAASPTPAFVAFSAPEYSAGEGAGRATVTVTRTGSAANAISVDVVTGDDPAAVPCATYNGTAYARCDYATTVETVRFAAGDSQPKTVNIPLIDDAHVEGAETVLIRLVNPSNAALGTQTSSLLTINDNNDAAGAANPILQTPLFVRMQYLDFLNREPETGEPWTGVLNRCPNVNNDPSCDRITVSKSFFESLEFRLKGLYTFTFYRVAFKRLPEYAEIIPDMRSVTGLTPEDTYARRALFATNFTQRPEFRSVYDQLAAAAFVNALLDAYPVQQITTPDPANPESGTKVVLTRADLIDRLGASSAQPLTRAQVLRAIVESDEVRGAEFNRAYVAMQYYGYLRRTPETGGYNNWLNYLNANPTDARTMVNGFMNSSEYRARFGQ